MPENYERFRSQPTDSQAETEFVPEELSRLYGNAVIEAVSPEARAAYEAIIIDLNRNRIELEQTVEKLKESSINVVTGLPGRYYYEKEIAAAHARFQRDPTDKYALILGDVDNLKQVNDRFGHPVGDKYLAASANAMRQSIREGDMLFSLGGDEMVGILYGVRDDVAIEGLFSRITSAFSDAMQELQSGTGTSDWQDIQMGISLGYKFPEIKDSVQEVEERADQEMYENKRQRKASQENAVEISAPLVIERVFGRVNIRYEKPKN